MDILIWIYKVFRGEYYFIEIFRVLIIFVIISRVGEIDFIL